MYEYPIQYNPNKNKNSPSFDSCKLFEDRQIWETDEVDDDDRPIPSITDAILQTHKQTLN